MLYSLVGLFTLFFLDCGLGNWYFLYMVALNESKTVSVGNLVRQVISVDDQDRQITSVKLNESNYHSWSHAIKVF